MKAIMDEVHFHQLKPGTEIELVKYRVMQIKKEL
jgi:serine/threonine-protein kinase RsbW